MFIWILDSEYTSVKGLYKWFTQVKQDLKKLEKLGKNTFFYASTFSFFLPLSYFKVYVIWFIFFVNF